MLYLVSMVLSRWGGCVVGLIKTKTKQNSQLVEFGLSLEKILPLMKFPRFGPVDKNHQFLIFIKIHHCRENLSS